MVPDPPVGFHLSEEMEFDERKRQICAWKDRKNLIFDSEKE